MMIPTAPITLDDMRWSEAEVRLLMEEFNAVLFTFNSFLLISIDSISEREAFVQMQWHNVTFELFSVPSATDDSLTFRRDCVVATVPSDDDVVTGIDELVWEGHDTVFVGFRLLPKKTCRTFDINIFVAFAEKAKTFVYGITIAINISFAFEWATNGKTCQHLVMINDDLVISVKHKIS